jgi:membrane-bound lytic murein transglycosylase A
MKALAAGVMLMVLSLPATAGVRLEPVAFSDLSGWAADDHQAALAAFRRSCAETVNEGTSFARPVAFGGTRADWAAACAAGATATAARHFFETAFRAFRVHDPNRPEGLFTGYYEPEVRASRRATREFSVPVHAKPDDLVAFDPRTEKRLGLRYGRKVKGRALPYFTRREIDEGALAGRGLEIAWLADAADLFFMQVQGSGRLRFADGSVARLAYAAKSGLPYTGIGGVLAERGHIPRAGLSMQAIRRWMVQNPAEARALMWQNRSYVFFREMPLGDASLGAPGAQHVALTPRRSLAVDRRFWRFGMPVWLDTTAPLPAGMKPFRHLMIAQDTGSAIIGAARGDVYWGWGLEAAITAGGMKSEGAMTVLLPRSLAKRLRPMP